MRKAIRSPEGDFTYKHDVQPLPKIGSFKDRLDALPEENEASSRRFPGEWNGWLETERPRWAELQASRP